MSTDPHRYASTNLHWPTNLSNVEEKQQVAARAAARVESGQIIGIGSGSSAYLVLWAIGDRVAAEGLKITVVTSSYETDAAAGTLGIATRPLGSVRPVWGVDGADEVDPGGRLLKGRGGAMFKEKILWQTAQKMYLAVDASKYVARLGQGFALPVEVDRHAVDLVAATLDAHGATRYELRLAGGKDGPVITETGNLVLDAWFDQIEPGLHATLKALPGVIETGLFEGYEYEIL
jgi:ribose 5-phosphate isomerase A